MAIFNSLAANVFAGIATAAYTLVSQNVANRAFEKELGMQRQIAKDFFGDLRTQLEREVGTSGFEPIGAKLQSLNFLDKIERQQNMIFNVEKETGKIQSKTSFLSGLTKAASKVVFDEDLGLFESKKKKDSLPPVNIS